MRIFKGVVARLASPLITLIAFARSCTTLRLASLMMVFMQIFLVYTWRNELGPDAGI